MQGDPVLAQRPEGTPRPSKPLPGGHTGCPHPPPPPALHHFPDRCSGRRPEAVLRALLPCAAWEGPPVIPAPFRHPSRKQPLQRPRHSHRPCRGGCAKQPAPSSGPRPRQLEHPCPPSAPPGLGPWAQPLSWPARGAPRAQQHEQRPQPAGRGAALLGCVLGGLPWAGGPEGTPGAERG